MKQQFTEYLEKTSLSKQDKNHLLSIFEYFNGNYPSVFANRIFLFEGDPGIGKSFLSKKLIASLKKPTLFLGQSQIFDNVKRVKNIKDLLRLLNGFKEGIVYVDDLKYIFNFTDFDELKNSDRHNFMNLLESFRDNDKKTILIMTLNDSNFMDDSWRDRIDVHIEFGLPSNENKFSFLKENFSEYVKESELKYISENTIGYNYRDLPQVIKSAYFHGEKKINLDSIKESLSDYTPSSMEVLNIKQGIKLKLKELHLKEELQRELKKILLGIKNNKELEENKAKHPNFFIFEGPAGVGKSYSVLALAGELGVPVIKINVKEMYGRRFGIEFIFEKIKRFQGAIVLIDDADKLIEGDAFNFNDGRALNAELNQQLDELEKSATVILSVNDSMRLGRSLRDRFKIIKFENPELEQRMNYFNETIKNSKIKFGFSEEYFAKITDGMNYRDMQRLWNECIFYAIENNLNVMTKEHLDNLIRLNSREEHSSTMFG